MSEENKHWTNLCANILYKCQTGYYCDCYANYCLWTKDDPKLDFLQWKELGKIEYEERKK